jgi:hypothetical protein
MEIVTSSDRPDLETQANEVFRVKWPEFIFHDPIAAKYHQRTNIYFPQYDVFVLDEGRVIAGGWGVPLRWDGTLEDLPDGYDGALVRSIEDHESGVAPTTFSFMAAAVGNDATKRGLAGQVLTALSERARSAGLAHVIAPLRPTLKHRYPTTPMKTFVRWTRPDGLSIDPWIRAHQRMGATILAPSARSMVISGTVGEWESWTEMVFPESGSYVVPDALGLVDINCETDTGTYVEEGLWTEHL